MKDEYISFEVLSSCTCNSESWISCRRAVLYKRFKSVLDLISEGIKQQEANYRVKRPESVFTGVGHCLFFLCCRCSPFQEHLLCSFALGSESHSSFQTGI